MGGKKGKKKSKKKKSYTKAQQMAKKRIAASKTISSVKAANKSSMQKKAADRHAKFKQTKVQTFGGKRTSFSKSEETRIKKAGYKVEGYSKAAPNKASGYSGTSGVSVGSTIKNPNPPKSAVKQTSGIGPVADGSKYAESLSTATNQPTKTTTGIGPYADGAKYAEALKASPPVQKPTTKSGMLTSDQEVAMLPGEGMGLGSLIGTGITIGAGLSLPGLIKNATDAGNKLKQNIERRLNPDADKLTYAGDLSGLSISPTTTGPNYFSIKSPETFGAPSQAEVDKAAGITAGGLNIGGGGFTPDKPSGSTSRAIRDMTSEQLADRYEASLDPNSFKGLSDGETRGVGPVASGRAYAAGLNVDNKNVENRIRSAFNAIPLVPNVRRLTDKEIADNRISAQKKLAYRKEMAKFRGGGGGGGGARLPVAPLTPEEILLPEETAVAQTGPDYQQAVGQTGVDPNRLMQIQQEAYAQAFNPYNPMTVGGFNPMFRFFGRRAGGMGRGAFRRAFRRD